MRRFLWVAPRRSLICSCWSSEAHKNVVGGVLRPFSTSEGSGSSRHRAQLSTRHLQVEIVDALRLGKRDKASNLLHRVGDGSKSSTADDFVSILEYCAKCPDPLFAMETWRSMQTQEIDMNRKCYMFIIQSLSKGGYLKEAYEWLTFLGGNHSISHALPIYNIYLSGCAAFQSSVHADYCLGLMETNLTGKSEITYWELLKLAVWQQNLFAAHAIWKECMKYYSPSIVSLRKFIWSFTRLGDLASACHALQHMVALAFQQGKTVTTSAEGRFKASGLDIPIPMNNTVLHGERLVDYNGKSVKCFVATCLEEVLDLGSAGINLLSKHPQNRSLVGISDGDKSLMPLPSFGAIDEGFNDFNLVTMVREGCGYSRMPKDKTALPVRKMLRWSFSDVIHACAHLKNCELAEELFLQMQSLGIEPSQHTFDGFVKAVISDRGVMCGMKVVKAMEERNLKPYNATLATLSVGYSRALQLDLAEALLDQISWSGATPLYPFNALLSACDVVDQPERAIRVLAKMKHLNIKSDVRTYELLYSLFGKVNAPYENGNLLSMADARKRIHAIEMDMSRNGVKHTYLSIKNLMRALGEEGMIKELFEYLSLVDNWFWYNDACSATNLYNVVLHTLVENNESVLAYETFRKMKSRCFPPDAATYNIMIDSCGSLRCYKNACAFLSMMLRDGFLPDTCTYTALMKILVANEQFEAALNLLDKTSAEGIELDVLVFNTILEQASAKGRIDIVEHIIEQMHRQKIQPDPSTCAYVFSAYLDQGFYNTAVEAIHVLSLRMISEEENVLEEIEADFGHLVHDEDLQAESRIVKLFNHSENLAAALLNLRWCAMNGFPVSWAANKSLWAGTLSFSYGVKTDQ